MCLIKIILCSCIMHGGQTFLINNNLKLTSSAISSSSASKMSSSSTTTRPSSSSILCHEKFEFIKRNSGIYIMHFDHPPPPFSFEINFFPPTNNCGGRQGGFGLEFIVQKDAFLRPFPPFFQLLIARYKLQILSSE